MHNINHKLFACRIMFMLLLFQNCALMVNFNNCIITSIRHTTKIQNCFKNGLSKTF